MAIRKIKKTDLVVGDLVLGRDNGPLLPQYGHKVVEINPILPAERHISEFVVCARIRYNDGYTEYIYPGHFCLVERSI